MISLKYIPSRLNTLLGLLLLIIGSLSFVLLYMSLLGRPSTLIFLFIGAGCINYRLAWFYLQLHKRTYISIDKENISIDRGLIRRPFSFKHSQIRLSKQIGNKIRFVLNTGQEYRIILDMLSLNDIDTISHYLTSKANDYEQ